MSGRLAVVAGWAVLGAACANRDATSMSGFVDAPVSAVASQVAGQLESLPVREGDRVKKGEKVAQLDARERAAAVAQAEANLNREGEALKEAEENLQASMPTVKGATADIERVQATLDEAQSNYQRTQHLVEGNASTPQALDSARARLLEARAQLQSLMASKDVAHGRVRAALAAVSNAKAAVLSSQAALDLAKVQLAEATITAPFDALVVTRNLEEGEWVAPGTPVVTLERTDQEWVRLDVEETHLSSVRLGQSAQVGIIALPGREFPGHVTEVGPEGDFAVNRDVKRGRPDIRTFQVRVALDHPTDEIRPGMTAEVRFAAAGGAGT
jgi:HlyD family secretion protein